MGVIEDRSRLVNSTLDLDALRIVLMNFRADPDLAIAILGMAAEERDAKQNADAEHDR